MEDYFAPELGREELAAISSLGLAHMGDAVYELLVRSWLCTHGRATKNHLHRETVARVCAPAQARALLRIRPLLSDAEEAVARRGRNANIHLIPKGASRAEYAQATALETLFGWLYLSGQRDRAGELFNVIMEEQ